MKKIGLLLIALLLVSCNSAEDCFKKSGDIIVKNVELQDFSKVKIFSGLALVIKQGATFEVKIEGGANFINDIELRKEGDLLTAKYNASCNFNREYKAGTIYVTAPNIEEIQSKTEQDIKSEGVLTFPILKLISMDENGGETGTGDFYLNLQNNQTVVETNFVSNFYLTGTCNQFLCNFWFGNSRVLAENFVCQEIIVFHRGSNDMILKPIQSISGQMRSSGNIILKNNPVVNNVEQLGTGQLIIN